MVTPASAVFAGVWMFTDHLNEKGGFSLLEFQTQSISSLWQSVYLLAARKGDEAVEKHGAGRVKVQKLTDQEAVIGSTLFQTRQ